MKFIEERGSEEMVGAVPGDQWLEGRFGDMSPRDDQKGYPYFCCQVILVAFSTQVIAHKVNNVLTWDRVVIVEAIAA